MSEWTSVEEQLPKIGEKVIAYKDWPYGVVVAEFTRQSYDHLRIIRKDGQWWDGGKRITHWMPLPEPPK